MTDVYIVDEIMGAGKTSAAINYINSHKEKRFLVITPYLNEIDRYMSSCKGRHFKQPYNLGGTKLAGIKELIRNGNNIVSTHALFQKFDDEVIDLCKQLNYTLIMDEVADVVHTYELSDDDRELLINGNFISIDEKTHEINWIASDEYEGKFEDVKNLCKFGCLCYYAGKVMVWLFPVGVFEAFTEVFIMTYMFNAQIQRYYYDYYNLNYKYIHVVKDGDYKFSFEKSTNPNTVNYRNLLYIVDDTKLNMIGDKETNLSVTWYEKNTHSEIMSKLKNNVYNFMRNIAGVKGEKFIWTTFKNFEHELCGKGYSKRFVPMNARATNMYRECNAAAYLVNRYLNPMVKGFFVERDIVVDEDGYALSEMLQFLWRCSIREQKEVTLYIPSSRMRNLLLGWIKENSV